MKLIKSLRLLGLVAVAGLALFLMSSTAAGANVVANVTAGGDNTCSGTASFSPVEVGVHPGDNVTLIFNVTENQDWSISTNHYTQWGTVLVPAGQSRSVSFVAPETSFSYQGSWSLNGCYRTSGVVRVIPLPVVGPVPPPPPPLPPPDKPDERTTFSATTPPTATQTTAVADDSQKAKTAGGNQALSAPVSGLLPDPSVEKVKPVTVQDILLVLGSVVFAAMGVAGFLLLQKHQKLKSPEDVGKK